MTSWQLDDADVSFGGQPALRRLNLRASPTEVVGLIGASGSGKSTLLRVLAAALPLTRGTAEVLAVPTANLWGKRLRSLRQDVGFMQQQHNVVEGLRVFHNVAMGNLGRWSTARALATLAWPRKADVETVERALERVELVGRTWDWPRELSGGERQRVALARLLVQAPRLWLADEPAAGLDPRLRASLLRQTIALVRERGAAAVISVHDTELLQCGFDRIIGLRDGRVALDTAAGDLAPSSVEELYAAQ